MKKARRGYRSQNVDQVFSSSGFSENTEVEDTGGTEGRKKMVEEVEHKSRLSLGKV